MSLENIYKEKVVDDRARIIFPGNLEQTLRFSLDHLLFHLNESIEKKGKFTCALSGGSTPLKLFKLLSTEALSLQIEWEKVFIFWGDERFVPTDSKENNYSQAMQAGLEKLPIPKENIFPIQTTTTPKEEAQAYETILLRELPSGSFDYVMLGLGEDGHTASLFPETEALLIDQQWACANYIPKLEQHRITLTLPCLNRAKNICFYAFGPKKAAILAKLHEENFKANLLYPASLVKPEKSIPTWICDEDAVKDFTF
jgi:6-phosphogluconolactonase